MHHNSESYQDVQNDSDPIHRMPSTKMWYIAGGETLRIVKLASKDLVLFF